MFQYLQREDQIGIFSPSSPTTVTAHLRFERSKRFLESKGFEIREGNLTGKIDTYRSGIPKERAAELNELIRNPTIKLIMSTSGGTNSNSILPFIDYEAFKANLKMVVGYSDATAVLLSLYAIPTYYGPALIPSFGEFEPLINFTYQYFENFFMTPQSLPYEIQMPPYWSDEAVNWETKTTDKKLHKNHWICALEGLAEGRLIGGNLNAMYGILGIGGIILGKHERFDDLDTARKPYEVLLEILDDRNIPVLAEFDACHTHSIHTLPIGRNVVLDATNKKVYLKEKWI
jgi:muramoyltetrapeptide carboxypeptidase